MFLILNNGFVLVAELLSKQNKASELKLAAYQVGLRVRCRPAFQKLLSDLL